MVTPNPGPAFCVLNAGLHRASVLCGVHSIMKWLPSPKEGAHTVVRSSIVIVVGSLS